MREQWRSGKGLSLRFKLAGEPKMRGPIKSKELLDSAWRDKITLRRFCLTLIGAFLFWLKGWGENPALHCRAVQQCRNLPAYRVSLNLKLLFPDLSCPSPCPRIPEQLMFAAVRGYINLSLLTLLGWQQWRTESKSLHNQRPQQFPQMCETPSVFRIVCIPRELNTANFAISDSGQGRERLCPQTKGESFCSSSSSAPPALPHHFSLTAA